MTSRATLLAVLLFCGAAWGLTVPLTKITVSEGYRHFGLIFWQFVIAVVLLGGLLAVLRRPLPWRRRHLGFYVVIALIGTLLPNSASYEAARFLPAGILSICIAMVPMFAFPIALLMGTDRFDWFKLLGLVCGLIGVALLIGPQASLPERAMVVFIPLALVAPAFYGFEGNFLSKYGLPDLDPVQLLCGASIIGAGIALPLALLTGSWVDPRPPWGAPDFALMATSAIHAMVYAIYFWLVTRAGAVFAAQVAYLVTGFGVVWAMLILAERYSGWVWLALVVMFVGLFLVQPRRQA
ncbi:Permease of the drug/metabolite transporter (DMT) superfamily [Candidatus Rhodobacter oscarellae]|uniref:Permease of the drug/metabolite transporter (DMT) superfamily n=1 Tax=Candidatus Rhodobacter oscarellae TaxID=1675527 RepID=A0A0J9GXI2_9RHOB|nr:DMT family transporter [Candidatus Rhodobacter lobularis]KMW58193.1 Permease of the drug/metabolite transporter (DMT) superfamily [Candidatus Rhodobacter lobularis]